MTEYIEREKLLQDISETVVFTVRKGTPLPNAEMRGANKVINQVKSAPTEDVVKVVRCKECRYWEDKNSKGTQGICNCGEMEMNYGGEFYPLATDYCSYGELKECNNG